MENPQCPNHPGIYLTCDNTAMGLRWKCTIHGCTVVGWDDLQRYTPADYETREARKRAMATVINSGDPQVYDKLRAKFPATRISINTCDKATCERIIEWAKGL